MTRVPRLVFLTVVLTAAAIAQPPPLTQLGSLPGDRSVQAATNSQIEHAVAAGDDGFLVVWSDSRGRNSGGQTVQSDGDIFGIRLDASGSPIDPFPFMIAGGPGLQRYPTVAWNGENWLVLYQSQDPVDGYFQTQIRAVRVSPQGVVLDATPILFPPDQFAPGTIGLTIAGQGGQWLITRCVYHNDGYGTYLAGQRIAGDGQLLDATPLMLNDWVYGATRVVVANGEYLVMGPDWNSSSTIKARRVGLNAQPIGASFTVPSINVASSGSEYYVVWIADYVNLVGSRMTLNGTLLSPGGTLIVSDFSEYHHAALAHDGTMWWVAWGAADELRTVRITAAGTVLDPNGGPLLPITIGGTINLAYSPILVRRSEGGVHLFWYDMRVALGNDANVYRLPINAENVPGAELCLSTGTTNQRNPDFARGAGDSIALVFVSEAANDDRVLVHFLDATGQSLTVEPTEVYRGPTVGKAGIAWNGETYLVTWDQGPSGMTPTYIKARRMLADGSFLDPNPIDVMVGFNADVEALGDDFLVAGTRFGSTPQFINLVGSRIDGPTGALLDGPAGLYLGGGYVNGMPRVRSDGTRWLVAAHSMWSHNSSQGDAMLAAIPQAGPPVAAFNPTPVSGGSGDLDIAFSGSKYLLVWRMNSLSNANNYVAGRIMNADWTFAPGYFTIAEAPGRQLRPTVTWDGATFIVAWDDQRNQQSFFDARTDIYGARVSETGAVLDFGSLPIFTGPEGDAGAALIRAGGGVSLVACANFDSGELADSYRIVLARIGDFAVVGDVNGDGVANPDDYGAFAACLGGPQAAASSGCDSADLDRDQDVDLRDYALLLLEWVPN